MHRKLIIQKQGKEIRKFFHLFVSLSNLSQGRQPFLIKEWISHEQKCVCVCTVGSRCVRVCMREREGERERDRKEKEKSHFWAIKSFCEVIIFICLKLNWLSRVNFCFPYFPSWSIECVRDEGSKIIIFNSLLTTSEASSIFWGCWVSCKN